MIAFTVIKHGKRFGIEIDDKHSDRIVTLPNGSTEHLRNLHDTTVWLTPSGIEGVPVTMPDRKVGK